MKTAVENNRKSKIHDSIYKQQKAFPEEYETIVHTRCKGIICWGNRAPDGDIQVAQNWL